MKKNYVVFCTAVEGCQAMLEFERASQILHAMREHTAMTHAIPGVLSPLASFRIYDKRQDRQLTREDLVLVKVA